VSATVTETQLVTAGDRENVRRSHALLCAQLGIPPQGRKGQLILDALAASWLAGTRKAAELMGEQLQAAGISFEVARTGHDNPTQ
jgi:hypothetical protein